MQAGGSGGDSQKEAASNIRVLPEFSPTIVTRLHGNVVANDEGRLLHIWLQRRRGNPQQNLGKYLGVGDQDMCSAPQGGGNST